jgi:hypothetical protein
MTNMCVEFLFWLCKSSPKWPIGRLSVCVVIQKQIFVNWQIGFKVWWKFQCKTISLQFRPDIKWLNLKLDFMFSLLKLSIWTHQDICQCFLKIGSLMCKPSFPTNISLPGFVKFSGGEFSIIFSREGTTGENGRICGRITSSWFPNFLPAD